MSWYPDLGNETMVAVGDHVRAVGWLSSTHFYRQGEVTAEFLARLRAFVRLAPKSADALYFPAFAGGHTCELCGQDNDGRNFGVPSWSILYVAPGMIAHYVAHHRYAPPTEFIEAVMRSPLPDTADYELIVERFKLMHQQWWELMRRRQEYAAC